jgi:hypothetical protein
MATNQPARTILRNAGSPTRRSPREGAGDTAGGDEESTKSPKRRLRTIKPDEEAENNAAVVARLRSVLMDPTLLDVTLVSEQDGSQTPAAQLLLASCSPMFSRMLAGSFAEAASRRQAGADVLSVHSAFGGEVLAAIVTFAATNDTPALRGGDVELLAELLEASEYYAIDGLQLKAKRALLGHAARSEEACIVLQACWERSAADGRSGTSSAGEVANAALTTIDEEHVTALEHTGCLCEGAMRRVLSSERTGANEANLFDALHRWVCADEDRRGEASDRLVACLSYDLMPPSFLRDVVAHSGLVPAATLSDAFQTLALAAESQHGFVARPRSLPLWSTGGLEYTCTRDKHGVEILGCVLQVHAERKGGREGGRERGREGERERGREGERERGREGGREGGSE